MLHIYIVHSYGRGEEGRQKKRKKEETKVVRVKKKKATRTLWRDSVVEC